MSSAAATLSPERIITTACGTEVAYRVRRSPRARRIRLTVTAAEGLIVTVPAQLSQRAAERYARSSVAGRASWAMRSLEGVVARRALVLAGPRAQLPSQIDLRAEGRILIVDYVEDETSARAVARERDGVLRVSTPAAPVRVAGIGDPAAGVKALRRWRDRTARTLLCRLVHECAAETGLPAPARVSVRGQRTRWGSCSGRGTLSLNRNLIFLPPHLVRYVLVHESAHLVHLDHSPRFWEEVRSRCPDLEQLRTELRDARDSYVPVWADA